jgi:hypothetical protein
MAINEKARTTVELDGQQAENQLNELKKRATDLRKELNELKLTKDPGYAAKKREFDKLAQDIDKAQKATWDLNAVLKNISGSSLKDLSRAQSVLNASLRNNKRDTEASRNEFKKKAEQLKIVKAEIAKVNGEMGGFKKANSPDMFNRVRLGWVALVGGIAMVWRGISRVIAARDEELQKTAELRAALKGNEDATKRLTRVAGELQRTTGISDETIKGHMAFLGLQGRNETQIKNTMKAAIDLSKVMGTGLPEALKMLDATFEGNIGRLSRLDAAFGDLTREQLQNGDAIDMVLEKYGGQAQKSFQAGLSGLRSFQLAIGDFQKTLGMAFVNGLNPFFQGISDLINKMDASLRTATKSSKELFDDQLESVVNLNTGILPLLNRYDELKTKTRLSTSEQEELRDIIQNVADTIPSAISGFDQYGNALSISTDRARAFINTEVSRLQVVNQKAITETERAIKTRERLIANSQGRIKEIEEKGFFEITEKVYSVGLQRLIDQVRRSSQEEISETISKNQTLINEVAGYRAELARLNGDFLLEAQKQREKDLEEQKAAELKRPNTCRSLYLN